MFETKLNISAEILKLNNPKLTLEQLGNTIAYITEEYNKESLLDDDFWKYRYINKKSHELFMTRQNEWQHLLDLLNKRQDEIIMQSEHFDKFQNNYY